MFGRTRNRLLGTARPLLLQQLGILLLCSLCLLGCKNVHSAQEVISYADSLDRQHSLYADTTILKETINALNRPVLCRFYHNDLAKAYYYLGRNYETDTLVANAAGCYVAADRQQSDDDILCGRINSCMGYLCSQQYADSVALIFYQRATRYFQRSGDERRYANSLLNETRRLIALDRFTEADSIWQLADKYQGDSMYIARLYETRGLYYDRQQMYDTALVWLLSIEDYPLSNTDKCSAYMKIVQAYDTLHLIEQAEPYARYIVEHSDVLNFVSNAYYNLILNAQRRQNADEVAKYAHLREDAGRLLRQEEVTYAIAAHILTDYLRHPNTSMTPILIVCLIAVGIIAIVGLFLRYRKSKNKALRHLQDTNQQQGMELAEHIVSEKAEFFAPASPIWSNYPALYEMADKHLNGLATRLVGQCKLNQQDVIICLLTLYKTSAKETAVILHRSQNSIGKLKSITAKKLNTTSPNLRKTLLGWIR